MNAALAREFRNPPKQYRGKPFWAWNGKLEPKKLRRQIRVLKDMGMGGFFMHARVGLDTPYLQDEWFKCVRACVDEAKACNMEAWMYDEDRWPSGSAGGIVTQNPKYRMRHLRIDLEKSLSGATLGKDVIALFAARVDGHDARGVRRLTVSKKHKLKRGESFIVFRKIVASPSSWYNDGTYLDTMNHEAVKQFIKETHEQYRRKIGRHFGRRVPGIFTDEPNYIDFWDRGRQKVTFPWTDRLPKTFEERYGYDIHGHMMEIFFDVDGVTVNQARHHYHDCLTWLFVDAFGRQIGDWCEKNGVLSTGHVIEEDTATRQAKRVGSAMRFYEHMQAPGMDLLTQYGRNYDTAKQVSSAAHQFGRKWRLTETYGCTGWDFPFEGHKALGDWQIALGINLRCQHLSWYTMKGEAKRDYPAGIFFQSPWWKWYPHVEDYFARITSVMVRGTEVRDVLVIHSVETAWQLIKYGGVDQSDMQVDSDLIAVRDHLLAANIDFDYADEDILARHGMVSNTKDGLSLRVARAVYRVVVVPSSLTLRASTLKILNRFVDQGGTVVFRGRTAGHVDGIVSSDVATLASRCAKATLKTLPEKVAPLGRRISIKDGAGKEIPATLHLLKEDAQSMYLFVCNTGHDHRKKREYALGDDHISERTAEYPTVIIRGLEGCAGGVEELNPLTGEVASARAVRSGDGWEIRTSLPRLGSRLFIANKKRQGKRAKPQRLLRTVRRQTLKRSSWDCTLSEPNVLVLDRAKLKVGSGKERPSEEILRVDNVVRQQGLGIAWRGGAMKQPWAQNQPARPRKAAIRLRYSFSVRDVPSAPLHLAVEEISRFAISINGTAIDTSKPRGYWIDPSLETVQVGSAVLKKGANEIVMACDYDESFSGLEIAYLLGEFGVAVSGTKSTIVAKPTTLKVSDWGNQGLPFYSGSVAYSTTIDTAIKKNERVFVSVPKYAGVAFRVLVDGAFAGTVGWAPNEVDITDHLGKGQSVLTIEIQSHRRNSHGPLHHTNTRLGWTGPNEFHSSGKDWTDNYVLVPCGLLSHPWLVVKA